MAATRLVDASSPLYALRRQVRLVRRNLTVLMPHNDYYVQKECAAALRALGHRVVEVKLGEGGKVTSVGDSLGLLMRACVAHRPDMLLTINYTGFDRAAWFDELVAAMGLPVAVWFVDSPFFLATGYLPPAPDVTSFFCWDQSFVPMLRAHGAERTFHLPLATDPDLFANAQTGGTALPLGFVGHTLDALVALWGRRDGVWEASERAPAASAASVASAAPVAAAAPTPTAEAWAQTLLTDRAALHRLVPHVGPPIDRNVVRLAHANYLASRTLRQQTLAALPQRALHVFGNPEWKGCLPRAHLHGGCAYGAQTARIYASCAINLNITNLQMPTAVNQRLFDVPAAGGFLLTDAQAEVPHYFAPDKEVVCFASPEELRDKAAYYGARPAARAAVVQAARRRTLAEHTYRHRMEALVATMRAHHGPGARTASREPSRHRSQNAGASSHVTTGETR